MQIKHYKDLIVWQKAMLLVTEIYRLVKLLPDEEIFGLSSQMRRAAVSIPSNIAEGYGRNTLKEYVRFLSIARGSNQELETQLYICINLGYLSAEHTKQSFGYCDEITKMLNSMISKLS